MTGMAPRILVVDDTAGIRRGLEITLTNAGYYVMQARNGAEAVRLWRDLGGELVILDLVMPEKDGMETIYSRTPSYWGPSSPSKTRSPQPRCWPW
jgi:DNA-binding response OmpR family regulator